VKVAAVLLGGMLYAGINSWLEGRHGLDASAMADALQKSVLAARLALQIS
jgi:hypothetical protein